MNLRNAGLYLSILFIMVVGGLMLQNVMRDMMESDRANLDSSSVIYMQELLSSIEGNNLNNITNDKSASEYQEENPLSDVDSGSSSITDVLASINVFRRLQEKIINPIKFVYNVPTFLLNMLGLELRYFSPMTQVLNLIIYMGIILLIIKELK